MNENIQKKVIPSIDGIELAKTNYSTYSVSVA